MQIFRSLFILETDASYSGLGAFLSQEVNGQNKPVAYANRCLRQAERNMEKYSSMKLELLAVKWALNNSMIICSGIDLLSIPIIIPYVT